MVIIVFVVGVVLLCKDNANRMQSPSSSLETAMLRCRLSYAKLIKKSTYTNDYQENKEKRE